MTTKEILAQCTVEGNVVKLPGIQLDRNIYLEIKKKLEFIGGKWKSGKVQGFVFPLNPTELLATILGDDRDLKKDYQFFATPKAIADKLVALANLQQEDTILEPSAGRGAIVRAINEQCDVVVDCCEILDINRQFLSDANLRVKLNIYDFLKLEVDNGGYSKIIANPPFAKNQDIEHVYKMWDCLAEGGRIVTIMSNHWRDATNKKETAFREWLENRPYHDIAEEIEAGAFKESGTNIAACIVVIDK